MFWYRHLPEGVPDSSTAAYDDVCKARLAALGLWSRAEDGAIRLPPDTQVSSLRTRLLLISIRVRQMGHRTKHWCSALPLIVMNRKDQSPCPDGACTQPWQISSAATACKSVSPP